MTTVTLPSYSTSGTINTNTGNIFYSNTTGSNFIAADAVYISDASRLTIKNVIQHDYSLSSFDGVLNILKGCAGEINLPDGSKVKMDEFGNYKFINSDAKVTYEANFNRSFNCYVNASELLRDFVKDLGKIGVTQDKVLQVPIDYFINWLIHKAADQDDDEYAKEGVPTLEQSKLVSKPRCKYCQRFLSKKHEENGMNYCGPLHMAKYAKKIGMELSS